MLHNPRHCSWFLSFTILGLSAVATRADEPSTGDAIGQRTCLFLDDRFVAEQAGLKRVWHQGQPREAPAIQATEPWEKWPHLYGSVFHDPRDGLYKMYYTSAIYPPLIPPDSFTSYICYAESADGKTWIKPNLGLWEHQGSKANNIVIQYAELANVFIDPLERDPAGRLKMFVYLKSHSPHGGPGESLLSSADGIHWSFVGTLNKPDYALAEQGNYTDSHFFTWDPMSQRYRGYIRTFMKSHVAEARDGRRRAIGMTESLELTRGWTPIQNVLAADDDDDARVAPFGADPGKPDWAELYCMHFLQYPPSKHYARHRLSAQSDAGAQAARGHACRAALGERQGRLCGCRGQVAENKAADCLQAAESGGRGRVDRADRPRSVSVAEGESEVIFRIGHFPIN